MPDEHVAGPGGDDLQVRSVDDIFKMRDASTQVRIIVLIDERFNGCRFAPGGEDLQHNGREIGTAASVDHHRFTTLYDKVRIAVQA